ncbi:hypothetical protein HPB52_008184 [Rhipicephalus sanguineus]|uniref:Uncharacterized protein n=1 Tax=Rhipicephalus sanguineus TaxID=34632 RepID=A0A9D4SW92_RHISA|nr:hypothetical protein HPB52_008184 [Rhipicephalus sanguineus]
MAVRPPEQRLGDDRLLWTMFTAMQSKLHDQRIKQASIVQAIRNLERERECADQRRRRLMLGAALLRQDTVMRKAISLDKRVAIALYRLATSAEDRTVANLFGVSRSSVNLIFREFCDVVVRRAELLLSYYAAKYMINLRKSGTEEQYSTREALLQEVLDLSREHGLRIRCRRAGNTVTAPRQRCALAPEAARISGAVKRDAAAAESAATKPSSGSDCVENGVTATDILNKIVSNEEEYNEAGVEFDSQFDEAESQHNGSTNGTDSRSQATPSPPNAAIVIAAQTVPPAPAAVPRAEGTRASNRAAVATEPVRGKKRQEQAADFEFLEKHSATTFAVRQAPRLSGVEALPSAVPTSESFGYGRRPFLPALI